MPRRRSIVPVSSDGVETGIALPGSFCRGRASHDERVLTVGTPT